MSLGDEQNAFWKMREKYETIIGIMDEGRTEPYWKMADKLCLPV